MNRSIEVLKEIYKPYKYTIKGHAHILKNTSKDIVIKEKKRDTAKLYEYLTSCNFTSFPELIDNTRDEIEVFEYLEDTLMPKERKSIDLIRLVANLHKKTSYYKEVRNDEYKKIYDEINAQIDYLKYYYDMLFDEFFKEVYPSPSKYFLLSNASKIFSAFLYAKNELEHWYEMIKDSHEFRVCQIHNNLKLEHFIKKYKEYLISWDNARIDSPVLDLISFYKEEYFNLPFKKILEEYLKINPLNEYELKLFFIVISIPFKIEFTSDEFINSKNIRKLLDYVYLTEELIRSNYPVHEK